MRPTIIGGAVIFALCSFALAFAAQLYFISNASTNTGRWKAVASGWEDVARKQGAVIQEQSAAIERARNTIREQDEALRRLMAATDGGRR